MYYLKDTNESLDDLPPLLEFSLRWSSWEFTQDVVMEFTGCNEGHSNMRVHTTQVCLTPDEDPAVMNMQPFFYMPVTLAMWKRPWSYFHLAGVKPKEDNKQSATKTALHNYLIPTKSKRRAKYNGPCYSTQSLLYCILKDRDSWVTEDIFKNLKRLLKSYFPL